jgi:hypothetical protein
VFSGGAGAKTMLVEVLGEMQSVIGIWVSDKQTSYADACGVIPEVGLSSFWRALGYWLKNRISTNQGTENIRYVDFLLVKE